MKIPFKILVLFAGALWISAVTMFAIGVMVTGLSVLRFAAIPDAMLALVFTAMAAQKWVSGSN